MLLLTTFPFGKSARHTPTKFCSRPKRLHGFKTKKNTILISTVQKTSKRRVISLGVYSRLNLENQNYTANSGCDNIGQEFIARQRLAATGLLHSCTRARKLVLEYLWFLY